MSSIEVALATDRYYFPQLAVTLRSLFETNPHHRFAVHVLTDDSYPVLEERVLSSVREFGHDVEFIALDLSRIGRFSTVHHLPHATYFRLAIPDVLGPEVRRILYLDTDILVQGDIGPLWDCPLHSAAHAAVLDAQFDAHEKLQIPANESYFNAGILLLDLDVWRREKIAEQAARFIEHEFHRASFADQCALNAVTFGRWRQMPERFNAQRLHFYEPDPAGQGAGFRPRRDADLDVVIAHFTGDRKPWDADSDHPLRDRWFAVLDRTAWAGQRPYAAKVVWTDLASRGRIWLFGAGGLGRKAKDRLDREPGATIAGIVDSQKSGEFDGMVIRRMAEIPSEALTDDVIVISTQFWQRLRLQLLERGARRIFAVYPFDEKLVLQVTPDPEESKGTTMGVL